MNTDEQAEARVTLVKFGVLMMLMVFWIILILLVLHTCQPVAVPTLK